MILVAGATGVLGSEIVRRLTARGEEVRAMVRVTSAPEKVERLKKLGADIVRADVKDPRTLFAACVGVEAVISTITTITTAETPHLPLDLRLGLGVEAALRSPASFARC